MFKPAHESDSEMNVEPQSRRIAVRLHDDATDTGFASSLVLSPFLHQDASVAP